MNLTIQIEKQLVRLLRQAGFEKVFNCIPQKAEYPYIHIEQISSKPWLVKPQGYIFSVKLCLYSLGYSNRESLELGQKIKNAIGPIKTWVEIEESVVYQLKNTLWCNEFYLKIWQMEGGDYEKL